MTNANQVELTEAQKEAIEDMVINRVNAMNNDQVLCDAIDAKVHEMEEHLKSISTSVSISTATKRNTLNCKTTNIKKITSVIFSLSASMHKSVRYSNDES